MKILQLAAVALLLTAAPAFAQWQTPNHSVPIGKGGGSTGFSAAVPGVAGKPLVSTGASTDPAFGNIANSGFTPGAANTYKGSLDGTTVADVAVPDCQSVSTALRYVAGSGPVCGNVLVQTGMDMPVNLGISSSAVGGALTINVTQASGSTPTTSSPVLVPFRSTTLTSGTVTWSTISSALSLTVPNGATLGTTSNVPFRVWVFLDANSGTPAIGVATCSSQKNIYPCSIWESTLVTSTSMSVGSDSGGVLYAAAGVALDAVRIIGYCDFSAGLATAGMWASACTTMQLMGPGIKKPGDVVQSVSDTFSSTAAINTVNVATGITKTISPTSTPNLIRAMAAFSYQQSGANSNGTLRITRNVAGGTVGSVSLTTNGAATQITTSAFTAGTDAPGTTSPTIYQVYGDTSSGTNFMAGTQYMELQEIMG